MTRWKKIALLVVVIATACFAASFLFPAEYKICGPNEYTHAKDCTEHYLGTFVILWVVSVLDAHNGLVTAIATVFVAGFTWTLWRTSKSQGSLAQQSIDLARKEFISTHRPRIILRAAYTGDLKEGHIIPIRLHIANIGETKGKIVSSTLRITEMPGDQRPAGGAPFELENFMDQTELEAGGSMLMPAGLSVPKWNADRFLKKWRMTTEGPQPYRTFQIWLTGQMIYIDDLGIPRRTSFYRVLDPERQRFYTVDEPDLDYAD